MALCSIRVKCGLLAGTGFVLIVFAIAVLYIYPFIVNQLVAQNFVLSNGTEMHERWQEIPVPIFTSLTFFNISNADAFLDRGEKPILKEVGPFVFKETRKKQITGFGVHEGLETVSYYEYRSFEFLPEKSVGDLDTTVTIVNAPLAAVGGMIDDIIETLPGYMRLVAKGAVAAIVKKYRENLVTTKEVRELIFDGYKVKFAEDLLKKLKKFKKDVKDIIPDNMFGLLYGQNNSHTGHFTVYTGKDDVSKYTQIVSWNNSRTLPFWNGEYCNMINGTDSEQFPPFVSRDDTLFTFTPDLCSSVPFKFEKESSIYAIPLLRFNNPKSVFAAPAKNPDRACYCLKDSSTCLLDGIVSLSPCQHGAPVYMSSPHFYNADESLREQMIGFDPIKEKHENFMDIEPTTGLVLKLARRIQINVHVVRSPGIPQLANVKEMLFPVAWAEVTGEVTEDLARELKGRFQTPISMIHIMIVLAVISGCISLLFSLKVLIFDICRKKKEIFTTPVVCLYDNIPNGPAPPEEKTYVFQDSVKTPLPPPDDNEEVSKPFIFPTIAEIYSEKSNYCQFSMGDYDDIKKAPLP